MRIGYGEHSHRLEEGRPLYRCGLLIPSPVGALAHSDGDAALHALTDALLSAYGLGDIGLLFPDTDPRWRGERSEVFLREALRLVEARGARLLQASLVLPRHRPKLGPHRKALVDSLARLLRLPRGHPAPGPGVERARSPRRKLIPVRTGPNSTRLAR